MIALNTINDSIRVILAAPRATADMPFFASYSDTTATTFTPGKQVGNTNGITGVSFVSAPPADTSRLVDHLSIYNNDTANGTVSVFITVSGTDYILQKVTLGPGEKMEYNNGKGWQIFTNAGALKNSINQGNNAVSSSLSATVLGTDVTNNNSVANTIADITGLSFPVVAGNTYYFRFIIQYTAAATTTGARFSINGPAASALRYESDYSLTTTSRTVNTGLAAYDLPAAANATSAATNANTATIEGFITASANGTVVARFASEVASSAIVARAGSVVYYQQVL